MVQPYTLTTCIHQHSGLEHLFKNPLSGSSWCDDTELLDKIVVVVFHILTLCIPLLIYKIASCLGFVLPSSAIQDLSKESMKKRVKEAQFVTEKALTFAKEQLHQQKPPNLLRTGIDSPPVDSKIGRLDLAYWEATEGFNQAIADFAPNQAIPWIGQETDQGLVQRAIDRCIRLTYALSIRTLNDWPQYRKRRIKEDKKIGVNSPPLKLAWFLPQHYPRYCFFDLAKFYHMARGDFRWVLHPHPASTVYPEKILPPNTGPIPKDVASLFTSLEHSPMNGASSTIPFVISSV